MKKLITIILLGLFGVTATAQTSYNRYDDRHYYDEEFDWHWDVRVRISDGIKSGLITNWESRRLYNKLERIEEKEYDYMADGNYDEWEQDDIWEDVRWLNRKVGLELNDFDRSYYGFNRVYFGFNTYPFWYNRYYGSGWDFYRFDRLGWGNYRYGYGSRFYYPRTRVYVFNNERYIYKNGKRYQNNNINKNGSSRNATARVDNRANGNVVRRDRTNPSARVGNARTGNATTGTRRTYGNSPNTRTSTTRPSSRTYDRSSRTSTRTYTPRENRDINRSSSERSRPSSTMRTAPSRSSKPSSTMRTSPKRSTSSARPSQSRSSRPSSAVRSNSGSRNSSARQAPSRSSSRSSAVRSSSGSSRSSSARSSSSRSSSRGSRN